MITARIALHRTVLTLAAMAAALGPLGCAVQAPPADLAQSHLPATPDQFTAAAGTSDTSFDRWLIVFDDPQLLALVTEALRNNPDVALAAARRDEAFARIISAASLLRPRVNATGDASRFNNGEIEDHQVQLGMQVAWEADVWGRLRSLKASVQQQAIASSLDYAFARQSLAALVADAWYLSIAARQQMAIDRDRLASEQQTQDVTSAKIDVGAGTPLENQLAVANVSLARDALQRSQAALDESVRALEVLLGRYPANELAIADQLPALGPDVPVGIPSALLERRPDVLAADRRVAAAFHREQSARAACLPRVVLSGSLGTLLDPSAHIWSIGANLLAPLYAGGAFEAEVRVATAQQAQALADYVAVGLEAFRDVETTLANELHLQKREAQLVMAHERLAKADDVAQARYEAGVLNIFDLNQVRRQYFETRSLLLQVRIARLRERINLYRALGGDIGIDADPALLARSETAPPAQ